MTRDAAQLRADISGRLAAIDSVTALEVLDRVVRDMVDVADRRRDAATVPPPHGVIVLLPADDADPVVRT